MIKKLLPLVFILVGAGAGVGAGIMLKPAPAAMSDEAGHDDAADHVPDNKSAHDPEGDDVPEYVELNNQFVVPVVSDDLVEALVVMSIGIEVSSGDAETVYMLEPKLRDALLQVMFDHANIGGFRGRFTDGNNLDVLRIALKEAAQNVVGSSVTGVMITDIARQDV